jgi:hypothetical protein
MPPWKPVWVVPFTHPPIIHHPPFTARQFFARAPVFDTGMFMIWIFAVLSESPRAVSEQPAFAASARRIHGMKDMVVCVGYGFESYF